MDQEEGNRVFAVARPEFVGQPYGESEILLAEGIVRPKRRTACVTQDLPTLLQN